MGPVAGEDGRARCPWAAAPGPMRDYHDGEWGRSVQGESAFYERLTLEAFQSGLSWSTILTKRSAFRVAFADFDADAVAGFGPQDEARLMRDPGIVRNRAKVAAAVTNARATVTLRADGGLERLVRSFTPADPPTWSDAEQMATSSPESAALAAALKKRGFVFVGPTTMYALMQAIGIVDPHLLGCFRRG